MIFIPKYFSIYLHQYLYLYQYLYIYICTWPEVFFRGWFIFKSLTPLSTSMVQIAIAKCRFSLWIWRASSTSHSQLCPMGAHEPGEWWWRWVMLVVVDEAIILTTSWLKFYIEIPMKSPLVLTSWSNFLWIVCIECACNDFTMLPTRGSAVCHSNSKLRMASEGRSTSHSNKPSLTRPRIGERWRIRLLMQVFKHMTHTFSSHDAFQQ